MKNKFLTVDRKSEISSEVLFIGAIATIIVAGLLTVIYYKNIKTTPTPAAAVVEV